MDNSLKTSVKLSVDEINYYTIRRLLRRKKVEVHDNTENLECSFWVYTKGFEYNILIHADKSMNLVLFVLSFSYLKRKHEKKVYLIVNKLNRNCKNGKLVINKKMRQIELQMVHNCFGETMKEEEILGTFGLMCNAADELLLSHWWIIGKRNKRKSINSEC